MTNSATLILFTALITCLLAPANSYSQYSDEPVFWEEGGTSGYYQNKNGDVFHRVFPTEKESMVLSAGKLIPADNE